MSPKNAGFILGDSACPPPAYRIIYIESTLMCIEMSSLLERNLIKAAYIDLYASIYFLQKKSPLSYLILSI